MNISLMKGKKYHLILSLIIIIIIFKKLSIVLCGYTFYLKKSEYCVVLIDMPATMT